MCPPNPIPVLISAARSADAHLAQAARKALEAIGQRKHNEPKGTRGNRKGRGASTPKWQIPRNLRARFLMSLIDGRCDRPSERLKSGTPVSKTGTVYLDKET